MVREVVSVADRAADVGRGAGAAQFHSLLARYCSGGETDADVGTTGLFLSEPATSGAARGRPGPAWYSTAPGGGGRRRRHGLCVYGRGSVARRHWPAPKPQLVAPGPLQYRRGGIRTSSATPGPPTARTNAPPSSPHPATTRSLRGRVIWSTGLRWGHSTRTGTFPYPRGHAARTGTGFLHPLTSNAPVRA